MFKNKQLEGWYAELKYIEYSDHPRIHVYDPDGNWVGKKTWISVTPRKQPPRRVVKRIVKTFALQHEPKKNLFFF